MATLQNVDFSHIRITGGFWQNAQQRNRKVTLQSVYDRFKETGRFDAPRCEWRDGQTNKPHIFYDSDIAKWIESVGYLCTEQREPSLEALADEVIDLMAAAQKENGYYNSFYETISYSKRFTERSDHELYCAGHLLEAALAYYQGTGKRKLLDVMLRYIDLIEKIFTVDHSATFDTPGHEEIELALAKLYDFTKEDRYLRLAQFFIDKRGNSEKDIPIYRREQCYSQSHLPVREQTTAEGHSVRAMYLYCGMADIAARTREPALINACKTLFDNVTLQRMYITGGIGSTHDGEAFTIDYDLPNEVAYTETCAAIGLALFAWRLQQIEPNSRYADIIERVLYNGFLSGLSLDGRGFFYENPLEIIPSAAKVKNIRYPITQRLEVFSCSCCPPNVTRFIAQLGGMLYTVDEANNTVYVHQFMESEADLTVNGKAIHITQKTNYPVSEDVTITCTGAPVKLAVRVPAWCIDAAYQTENGYAFFSSEQPVSLHFPQPVQVISADPRIWHDAGRQAVMRGPVVYCLESVDNGSYLRDITLLGSEGFTLGDCENFGVPTVTVPALRHVQESYPTPYMPAVNKQQRFTAKLIPYFGFANRGESEMLVWTMVR